MERWSTRAYVKYGRRFTLSPSPSIMRLSLRCHSEVFRLMFYDFHFWFLYVFSIDGLWTQRSTTHSWHSATPSTSSSCSISPCGSILWPRRLSPSFALSPLLPSRSASLLSTPPLRSPRFLSIFYWILIVFLWFRSISALMEKTHARWAERSVAPLIPRPSRSTPLP